MTSWLTAPTPLFVAAVAALGLLVGSFVNVVVHRVPAGQSVVRPRSACPACAHPIRPRDTVPVVSWLVLHGRCRDCSAPVPARYPLVEAATAGLFGALAAAYGPVGVLPALLYVAAAGVALAVIDVEHHRLPDAIVLPAYPAVAVLLALAAIVDGALPVGRAAGSAAGWLAVYGVLHVGTRGRGMGLGDVKLAGVLGLLLGWLGWGPSIAGLFGGFGVGAAVGIALLASGRASRGAPIAHGPFLLLGAALGVFAGEPLARAWLALVVLG